MDFYTWFLYVWKMIYVKLSNLSTSLFGDDDEVSFLYSLASRIVMLQVAVLPASSRAV